MTRPQLPLYAVPLLTIAVLTGPVLAGLIGTLAPAMGYLPAAGQTTLSLDPIRALLDWPGLSRALTLSITTGLASTLGALALTVLIVAGWHGTRAFAALERMLSPLLAVPHAAAAFGLAFLIAPSGWLARATSPWLTGWDRPPDLLIVQDPMGLTLTAGLLAKELPFLLLMTLAALPQTSAAARMRVARSLGQPRVSGWLKAVFPSVYAQIRLPVYVVLAYGMSTVDVAIILGPNTPPTLSVQTVRWMSDPDLAMRLQAAAAALLQLTATLTTLALWWGGERIVARAGRAWIAANRALPDSPLRAAGLTLGATSAAVILAGIAGLALWSTAGRWRFPDATPQSLILKAWSRHGPDMAHLAADTLLIAAAATAIALILTIGCLEAEHRHRLPTTTRALWLLYLPLLIPQVAFLPGLQTLFLTTGLTTGTAAVIAAHTVFVLPYVFLSLADPFRAWDSRYATTAAAMGAGPDRILWRLRLPMLLAPILTAAAVGMAVSVGQYLPTLLIGAGRVPTLTTEAVALAAGGDRRAIGVFALGQTAAALTPFALALLLPRLIFRHRTGVLNG